MLRANTGNRSISRGTVSKYAQMMKDRVFLMNGEPIIFNGDGTLQNGQHRLEACVQANTAFESLVVHGVSKDAFLTMDQGKKRSFADALSTQDVPNHVAAAAITRCILAMENRGTPDTTAMSEWGKPMQWFVDRYHQDAELIQKGVLWAAKLRYDMLVSNSAVGFSYFWAAKHDEEAAELFFDAVHEPFGLNKRDPAMVLHMRLAKIGTADIHRLEPIEQCAFFIKAFSAFVRNRELGPRQLQWRRFGPTAESFPAI